MHTQIHTRCHSGLLLSVVPREEFIDQRRISLIRPEPVRKEGRAREAISGERRKEKTRKNKEENTKRHFDFLLHEGLGHEIEQTSKQQRGWKQQEEGGGG